MKAYTHQPFHVRRHGSTNDLHKLTKNFIDGRATQKITPGNPRRGSAFPLQSSSVYPSHGDRFHLQEDTTRIKKGPKMELQWEQNQVGKLPGMLRTPKDLCFIDDR